MRSKNGGDGGTGVYMREGTTSRVTVADRTYGKFYDFYSVSPENFGSTHALQGRWQHGEKVGYCYPSGLEKTLCKWDVYVPLVTKGLNGRFPLPHTSSLNDSQSLVLCVY